MSAALSSRWCAAAAAALSLVAATAGAASAPLKVHLEAIDESVVRGLPVAQVETALRKRLARVKGVQLVPEPREAQLVLRVTECLGWSEKHRVTEADERPVGIPTKSGGIARGKEGAYGVKTETRPQVSLVVRATWPDQFTDLQSATGERQLKGAVDSVASQLASLVRHGLKPR